jgi:sugar phosphate permease
MPYLIMAVSSIGGGVLADRLIARGHSPVPVRKGFLVAGLIATAILLPTALFSSVGWALTGLLTSCLAFGFYASNLFALTQTLAGPEAAGRWTGVQNASGNLAGIASSILTGWLVAKTGQFAIAFVAAGMACLLGAASFFFLVRSPHSVQTPHRE